MKYTKKQARATVAAHKDNTAYFDGSLSFEQMYGMLRYNMHFGEAETQVIISALVASGAKFTGEFRRAL